MSNIAEAIKLRKLGIEGDILILGYTPIENISQLLDFDITQAIISEQYFDLIMNLNLPIKCCLAIDTGMNRIGLNVNNVSRIKELVKKSKSILNIIGCFTHLCVADSDSEESILFTNKQIELFESLLKDLAQFKFEKNHCLNSADGLVYESKFTNFVRLGIVLYGLKPDYRKSLPEEIKPILSWKSVVSMVKTVEKDETIGYGRTFRVEKK